MPNGGFDFFGSLGDAIGSVLAFFQDAIVAIVNFLLAAVQFLYDIILAIVRFLGKALAVLIRGFKHVISDIIHGRFLHLYEDYLRLKARLKKWFEDHLGWLLRLRKAFDDWYRHTIIPILNMIQRIRAILAVFRIFHLKFAQKLDDWLGALEAKIIRNTLALRGKLNEVVSILELVLDPALLIRDNVFLASAVRALKGLFGALGLGFGRPLTAQEAAMEKRDAESITVAGVVADASTHPAKGLSPELLTAVNEVEAVLPPLQGQPASRFT